MPAAWAIRPQFGSRPKSAVLTSGELAIARATRSASLGVAAPRASIRPAPRRALAVGDDLERELEQDRVEQARRAAARPPRRSPAAGPCRWCDICPSTVIRSKEASTAPRRAASGSLTMASVCTKQSMVAKPGSIIPAPLAWAESVTPPARTQQRFGPRSVVMIASENAAPPASDSSAATRRFRRARRRRRAARRSSRSRRRRRRAGSTPSAVGAALLHRDGVAVALLAGRGVGVARVDDRRADRAGVAALAADADRRRGGGVAGQQQRRGHLRRSRRRRSRRRSRRSSFSPQATPGGPEARAQARSARAPRRPAGGSTQRERKNEGIAPRYSLLAHRSPSSSSSPSIRLRFWIACPAAPFQRLSIAREDEDPPAAVDGRVDPAEVRVADLAHAGRAVDHLDERLAGVALGVEGARASAAIELAARRHVTGDQLALVERQQMRDEGERAVRARRRARRAPARSRARGDGPSVP